jgi:hypothetical protein
MPTAEEVADAVWSRHIQPGVTAARVIDRTERNVNELIVAHRTGTLGTTAVEDIDDDDLADIAKAVNDELARRAQS